MQRTPETKRTKTVLTVTAMGLLIYELWTWLNKSQSDTISAAVWDWQQNHPWFSALFGLAVGLLSTHFFYPYTQQTRPAVYVILGAALISLSVCIWRYRGAPLSIYATGIIVGILAALLSRWQYAGRPVK